MTTNGGETVRPGLKRAENTRRAAVRDSSPSWNQIEDHNLSKFMENLRAAGCPEETIREIVTFRVCHEFRERLLAAEAEAARAWNPVRNRTRQEWNESRHLNQELRDEMMGALESTARSARQSIANALLGWPGRQ